MIHPVVMILFGAAFTVALATSLGSLLLRALRLQFHRGETALFAFICGSACLSLAVFLLCLIGQARKGVFLWGGLPIIAYSAWLERQTPARKSLPALPARWKWLFYSVFSAFATVYFFHALAPEVSPDGMAYHLGNVSRYLSLRGFDWEARSMYSFLSQGMEMLFLVAFALGRHSAAALVHCGFLLCLPWLMLSFGRRYGMPAAAVFAAVFLFTSPVVGNSGSSAYNDVAVATVIYAVFYLLQVWDETRHDKLLILCGLLAGFAYGIKYTAGLAIPFAIGFVLWRTRGERLAEPRRFWLRLARVTAPAAALACPWMLRNWIWLGNPFAPFMNRWFPNPFFHPGMEQLYGAGLREYTGIEHAWQVPLHLATTGYPLEGVIGPALLLAPFSLFALRQSQGRRLLMAALLFALPSFLNVRTRFLIPCLPFLALALGLALSRTRGALVALTAFEALACWPYFAGYYTHQWTWRIQAIPFKEALRIVPEEDVLQKSDGRMALRPFIEAFVPKNAHILSSGGAPEAYINRRFTGSYDSTLANLARDVMIAPISVQKVTHRRLYRVMPVSVMGVRMVQTERQPMNWTVSEFRVYRGEKELPRAPGWRLSAKPNGWEVQLAFDNTYVTQWSTWKEGSDEGDRIQVEFGRSEVIDQVALECAGSEAHLRLEVLTGDGRWVPMTDKSQEVTTDPPIGLRRAAGIELKALGFDYLIVNDSDPWAEDTRQNARYWGITPLIAKNGSTLYRFD